MDRFVFLALAAFVAGCAGPEGEEVRAGGEAVVSGANDPSGIEVGSYVGADLFLRIEPWPNRTTYVELRGNGLGTVGRLDVSNRQAEFKPFNPASACEIKFEPQAIGQIRLVGDCSGKHLDATLTKRRSDDLEGVYRCSDAKQSTLTLSLAMETRIHVKVVPMGSGGTERGFDAKFSLPATDFEGNGQKFSSTSGNAIAWGSGDGALDICMKEG